MEEFYSCIDCNMKIRSCNKKRHEKSKRHQNNTRVDCTICLEKTRLVDFDTCLKCKQIWCKQCDTKLAKCPFCRELLTGKEHILEDEKRERILEYERELIEEEGERIRRITFTIPRNILDDSEYFQTVTDLILMTSLSNNFMNR